MRLTEFDIKRASLHPERPIRTMAVDYFSRSFTDDASVMPLVIEAVEKYGRQSSVHLVHQAQTLPQSTDSIRWCLDELQSVPKDNDLDLVDYQAAILRLLLFADPRTLADLQSEIVDSLNEWPEVVAVSAERLEFMTEDPETLWIRLQEFCDREQGKKYLNEIDMPLGNRLVEALGRHASEEKRVIRLLDNGFDPNDSSSDLMQGFILRLAGEQRLKLAIPALVELLHEDNEWIGEECQRALIRIGGTEVLDELAGEFSDAEWHFRLYGAGAFEYLHTATTASRCLELFEQEDDDIVKPELGRAALAQFDADAIEPVRRHILNTKLDPETLELRESLVSVATLLDVDFPEREAWKAEHVDAQELRRKVYAEKYGETGSTEKTDLEIAIHDEPDFSGWDDDLGPASDTATVSRQAARTGRNDPCPCGSGKKFKKCCLKRSGGSPLAN